MAAKISSFAKSAISHTLSMFRIAAQLDDSIDRNVLVPTIPGRFFFIGFFLATTKPQPSSMDNLKSVSLVLIVNIVEHAASCR